MTEIAFLLDLVLNHKMSKDAKERCIKRIAEVEAGLVGPYSLPSGYMTAPVRSTQQAPSTQALMAAHDSTELTAAAQSPAARAALQSREAAIAQAASGRPEPGKTGPRKF